MASFGFWFFFIPTTIRENLHEKRRRSINLNREIKIKIK